MNVLVTRPIEDGERIARHLTALGHQPLLAPLLAVQFLDAALDLAGIQAILATSANGVRALARLTDRRDLPVFAVGPQTAAKARALGFSSVTSADGDAQALARSVSGIRDPRLGALLHAAGEKAGDALKRALAEKGFEVVQKPLYRMVASERMPPEAAKALRTGELGAALFFSPKSAALFAKLARADKLPTDLVAVCISQNTADALKEIRFPEIRIAGAPNQDALLACL